MVDSAESSFFRISAAHHPRSGGGSFGRSKCRRSGQRDTLVGPVSTRLLCFRKSPAALVFTVNWSLRASPKHCLSSFRRVLIGTDRCGAIRTRPNSAVHVRRLSVGTAISPSWSSCSNCHGLVDVRVLSQRPMAELGPGGDLLYMLSSL